MRPTVIVQARTTSTRLPGKVLADLAGKPMFERQLERLARCTLAHEVVVATTVNATDDPLVALADRLGLRWFRGSESDVLGRYVGAAREARADMVVRVTSDCPLIDPVEVDRVIAEMTARRETADYAANVLEPHLPLGLACEALWRDVLDRMDRLGTQAPAREHVTWLCRTGRPELFVSHSVRGAVDAPDLRWTVDTPEDLEVARRLYEELGLADAPATTSAEIVAYCRAHPEIPAINAHVEQKTV